MEKKQLQCSILSILSKAEDPVGSGYICEYLKLQGYNISEATVGRILRELDIKGYTQKIGFKGRSLTLLGKEKLIELETEKDIHHYGRELISAIKATGLEELLEILTARKVIESQLAKLAAQCITDEEIVEVQRLIDRQQMHVELGQSIAQDDVDFHNIIARIARNRVLETAMALIRQHGQLSPIFEYIRKEVKSGVVLDHKEIYEALAKKDPEAAEKAMVKHITNLEADVIKYWENVYENAVNS